MRLWSGAALKQPTRRHHHRVESFNWKGRNVARQPFRSPPSAGFLTSCASAQRRAPVLAPAAVFDSRLARPGFLRVGARFGFLRVQPGFLRVGVREADRAAHPWRKSNVTRARRDGRGHADRPLRRARIAQAPPSAGSECVDGSNHAARLWRLIFRWASIRAADSTPATVDP